MKIFILFSRWAFSKK